MVAASRYFWVFSHEIYSVLLSRVIDKVSRDSSVLRILASGETISRKTSFPVFHRIDLEARKSAFARVGPRFYTYPFVTLRHRARCTDKTRRTELSRAQSLPL